MFLKNLSPIEPIYNCVIHCTESYHRIAEYFQQLHTIYMHENDTVVSGNMLVNFIIIAGVFAYTNLIVFGFIFDVEVEDDMVPCVGKENLFFTSFMDVTNAELFKISGFKLMANGTIIMLKDLPKDKPITVTYIQNITCSDNFYTIQYNYNFLLFLKIDKSDLRL